MRGICVPLVTGVVLRSQCASVEVVLGGGRLLVLHDNVELLLVLVQLVVGPDERIRLIVLVGVVVERVLHVSLEVLRHHFGGGGDGGQLRGGGGGRGKWAIGAYTRLARVTHSAIALRVTQFPATSVLLFLLRVTGIGQEGICRRCPVLFRRRVHYIVVIRVGG